MNSPEGCQGHGTRVANLKPWNSYFVICNNCYRFVRVKKLNLFSGYDFFEFLLMTPGSSECFSSVLNICKQSLLKIRTLKLLKKNCENVTSLLASVTACFVSALNTMADFRGRWSLTTFFALLFGVLHVQGMDPVIGEMMMFAGVTPSAIMMMMMMISHDAHHRIVRVFTACSCAEERYVCREFCTSWLVVLRWAVASDFHKHCSVFHSRNHLRG